MTYDVRQRVLEDYERLLRILPVEIRKVLRPVIDAAEEVKLRFGRELKIKHHGRWHRYGEVVIDQDHLTDFRSRFDAIRDDNRAGIDGTGHRISRVPSADGKGTDGFNVRIGRFYSGVAEPLRPYLHLAPSTLIVGLAGRGKTTLLRDIARIIGEKWDANVTIVDTSNEAGGDGRVPHPGIGQCDRYFVPVKARQHEVMLEAIANNSCEILVIDEVQTKQEADTIRHLAPKAQFVATTHGDDLAEVFGNAPLSALFDPAPMFRWALHVRAIGVYDLYDMGQAFADVRAGREPRPAATFDAHARVAESPAARSQEVRPCEFP